MKSLHNQSEADSSCRQFNASRVAALQQLPSGRHARPAPRVGKRTPDTLQSHGCIDPVMLETD
jgi:hypothetical protein